MQQPAFPGLAPPPQHQPGAAGPPGAMVHPSILPMNPNASLAQNPVPMMRPSVPAVLTDAEKTILRDIDTGIDLLKILRMEIDKMLRYFTKGIASPELCKKFAETILSTSRHVSAQYDKVEAIAKELPLTTPHTHTFETMKSLVQDSCLDITTAQFFEAVGNLGMTSDIYSQTYHYMYEFLRSVRRKGSIYVEKTMNVCQADRHCTFIQMFKLAANEARKKGWDVKQKENCPILSVYEMNFYGMSIDIGAVRDLRTLPILLKMAILINSGTFEYVQFIAPKEEWTYLEKYQYKDDAGVVQRVRQIDPFQPSRHFVYQRMAMAGNLHIIHNFNNQFNMEPKPITFNKMLGMFTIFNDVFSSKCRYCHKILNNFMPPLPLLYGMKGFCHEKCMP